eukprot:TRINITY_DN84706_c0_g1_i1.p1 TRINITY_DN84706_c0_g1~~TRINITY_DN84706_c0_g1_i1.p1  ORF type:complete len:133 (+),score=26.87 TRINITY_DN84706_c0_g1_i1:91-489(+)
MAIESVNNPVGPPAVGPYCHAVVYDRELIFLSGQIGMDRSGHLVSDDVRAQTVQALENIRGVLATCGSAPDKVLKVTVLLADMKDYATVNEVYSNFFGTHKPARAAFAVAGLPKGAKVEIEMIATKQHQSRL